MSAVSFCPAVTATETALFALTAPPSIATAADEAAVARFLAGGIAYTDIAKFVEKCLDRAPAMPCDSLDAVFEADKWVRKQEWNI